MLLAIGDIVRVRSDQTIGTVTGIAKDGIGSQISLQMNGYVYRNVEPQDVELLARGFARSTVGNDVTNVVLFILGLAAGATTAIAIHNLGGGLLLTLFLAFAATSTVTRGLIRLVNRPRRIRI